MTINNKSERNYRGNCLGWPVTSYDGAQQYRPSGLLKIPIKSTLESSLEKLWNIQSPSPRDCDCKFLVQWQWIFFGEMHVRFAGSSNLSFTRKKKMAFKIKSSFGRSKIQESHGQLPKTRRSLLIGRGDLLKNVSYIQRKCSYTFFCQY